MQINRNGRASFWFYEAFNGVNSLTAVELLLFYMGVRKTTDNSTVSALSSLKFRLDGDKDCSVQILDQDQGLFVHGIMRQKKYFPNICDKHYTILKRETETEKDRLRGY